MIDSHRY